MRRRCRHRERRWHPPKELFLSWTESYLEIFNGQLDLVRTDLHTMSIGKAGRHLETAYQCQITREADNKLSLKFSPGAQYTGQYQIDSWAFTSTVTFSIVNESAKFEAPDGMGWWRPDRTLWTTTLNADVPGENNLGTSDQWRKHGQKEPAD